MCLGKAATHFLLFLKGSFQVDVFTLTEVPAALWGCDGIGQHSCLRGTVIPPPQFLFAESSFFAGTPLPSYSASHSFLLKQGVRGPLWRHRHPGFWSVGGPCPFLFASGASQGSGPSKYSACTSFLWMCPPRIGVTVASPLDRHVQAIGSSR